MVIRNIISYKERFVEFYKSQDDKVQRKIEYVLDIIRHEQHVPAKFFKSLSNTNGIHEIRVITTFKSIRILCFIDHGNIIVLTNCFLKKTQITPKKEIQYAEKLKEEYLTEKYGGI